MPITLDDLLTDPALMLFAYEADHAQFVRMDRDSYFNSIFCDQRVKPSSPGIIRVPLAPLLDGWKARGAKRPQLNFIHHMAQSGSTLLARAIDRPGKSLVIREPLHLRQLGVQAGTEAAATQREPWQSMLDFSLAMLGKRFGPDQPVIVKGSVPVSLIAGNIANAAPGSPTILLYYRLKDYCSAVLRTARHQQWLASVVDEIGLRDDPALGDLRDAGIGEKAAALWLLLTTRMTRLLADEPAAFSLDANLLFDQPAQTIEKVSAFFATPVLAEEARQIAASSLFTTYSKNPAVAYDPGQRVQRRLETESALSEEIRRAEDWANLRAERLGLPKSLVRPLFG